MQTIINTVVFLLILGSIIIIHELGHFLAAKFFGVYCAQFSIGFGPKVFSKKGKETEYELRALPFGGFVSMAGEDDQEENENIPDLPVERTLKGKKTYQKVIIFLAGVFMNFVLAIVVLLAVNLSIGTMPVDQAQIGTVLKDSVAEKYGLQANDIIQQIEVENTNKTIIVDSFDDVRLTQETLKINDDMITIHVTYLRNHQKNTLKMNVNYSQDDGIYKLGITQATRKMNASEAVQYSVSTFGQLSLSIVDAVRLLVTRFTDTVGQLSGPAGIYQITAEVTESGQVGVIFNLLAMLSINIGIFNLLPIPGLDGCQVLFVLVEKVIGRELPQKLKIILQMMGLGLVMLLMIVVTYQDILRIFG